MSKLDSRINLILQNKGNLGSQVQALADWVSSEMRLRRPFLRVFRKEKEGGKGAGGVLETCSRGYRVKNPTEVVVGLSQKNRNNKEIEWSRAIFNEKRFDLDGRAFTLVAYEAPLSRPDFKGKGLDDLMKCDLVALAEDAENPRLLAIEFKSAQEANEATYLAHALLQAVAYRTALGFHVSERGALLAEELKWLADEWFCRPGSAARIGHGEPLLQVSGAVMGPKSYYRRQLGLKKTRESAERIAGAVESGDFGFLGYIIVDGPEPIRSEEGGHTVARLRNGTFSLARTLRDLTACIQ